MVPSQGSHHKLGYFGQLTQFKGLHVLLEAMKILTDHNGPNQSGPRLPPPKNCPAPIVPHLWVFGANLDFQPVPYQNKLSELVAETKVNVTWVGPYDHPQLPGLLSGVDWVIVPSVWWENSPLVIQEAFLHGRPVICSDIGGMAEKVAHGTSGLHFRAGDAKSLAETLWRAIGTPGLWEKLSRGIPAVYSMDQQVRDLGGIYNAMLAEKQSLRQTIVKPYEPSKRKTTTREHNHSHAG